MGASGLGSLLVKEGFLTEQDRLTITKTCGQGSWAFAKSILAIGLLDEDELAAFFAERTRYQIAPKNFLAHLDQSAVQSVDKRLVSKLEVIPLKRDPGKITVGVVDPLDRSTLKQLEFFTGLEVTPVVVPLSQLYEGLHKIDPAFKLQTAALSHFLKNHAQSAWIRQKLDAPESTNLGAKAAAAAAAIGGVEEVYDDIPEIEEIEDIDDFNGLSGSSEEAGSLHGAADFASEDSDPFAGAADEELVGGNGEAPAAASVDDDDFASELKLDDAEATSASEDDLAVLDDDLDLAEEESGLEDFNASSLEDDLNIDEEGDSKPARDISALEDLADLEAEPAAVSSFGFEETKPRSMPVEGRDNLDLLGSDSLDLETSSETSTSISDSFDPDLLEDLHAETEPEPGPAPTGDSGLNPTSLLNEAMVRLSLCFTADSVMDVLEGQLHNVGTAGCLIHTAPGSKRQLVWADGSYTGSALSPTALAPMTKAAKDQEWAEIDLDSSESWTKKKQSLALYRQGSWLWAHQVNTEDDKEIFRSTVEGLMGQVANKA